MLITQQKMSCLSDTSGGKRKDAEKIRTKDTSFFNILYTGSLIIIVTLFPKNER